jgi:adenine-specific DNA methylase
MMNTKADVFYNAEDRLTKDQQVELLEDAKTVCVKWWVDELDCKKSFARQRIEMSWEDAIEHFKNVEGFCMVSVIERKEQFDMSRHLEVSYRIQDGRRDLFLWIVIQKDIGESFVKKHGLT